MVSASSVLVIAPLLTANAYSLNGFYDYFNGTCDESCLKIPIDRDILFDYRSSSNALIYLQKMGYDVVPDVDLESDRNYLDRYETIVVLHEEYVTQQIFDMITEHPNVYYLYPNALYGEVVIDVDSMTLVRGHGYQGVNNAFDWEFENTRPDEYDDLCIDYSWNKISNGWQLNCYPENAILDDDSILEFIK